MMLRRLKLLLDHKIRLHQRCQLPLTIAGVLLPPENIHTHTQSHTNTHTQSHKHTYAVTQTHIHRVIQTRTHTHFQPPPSVMTT